LLHILRSEKIDGMGHLVAHLPWGHIVLVLIVLFIIALFFRKED